MQYCSVSLNLPCSGIDQSDCKDCKFEPCILSLSDGLEVTCLYIFSRA